MPPKPALRAVPTFVVIDSGRRAVRVVRTVVRDPRGEQPDASVLVDAEPTSNDYLAVGPHLLALRPRMYWCAGYAVIHVPTGLAIMPDLTQTTEAAHLFAEHLAATTIDWSRSALPDNDDTLRSALIHAVVELHHTRHRTLTRHIG